MARARRGGVGPATGRRAVRARALARDERTPRRQSPVYASTLWDSDGGPLPPSLVIGGNFGLAGSAPAAKVAVWNGQTWQALGAGITSNCRCEPWSSTTASDRRRRTRRRSRRRVVGRHELAAARRRIEHDLHARRPQRRALRGWVLQSARRVDTTAGSLERSRLADDRGRQLGAVNALASFNGGLVAGGSTYNAPESALQRRDLERVDLGQPRLRRERRGKALTIHNGALVAGGTFTLAGGAIANRVAAWNGSAWQPFAAGVTDPVTASAHGMGVSWPRQERRTPPPRRSSNGMAPRGRRSRRWGRAGSWPSPASWATSSPAESSTGSAGRRCPIRAVRRRLVVGSRLGPGQRGARDTA